MAHPPTLRRTAATVALLVPLALLAAASPSSAEQPAGQPVPGSFILTLDDDADADAVAREYAEDGAEILHVYRATIRGFAGRMSDPVVRQARRDGRVRAVEADRTVTVTQTTQSPATWGLDRIDQRDRPLDTSYHYTADGAGVRAYVIDTGIRGSHAEFSGRMAAGATAINDGRGTNDCNGHGTHVAGTVGGTTYGAAKAVTLVPVRVLNCQGSGTTSGVIAGVDWVAGQSHRPAVANMSLGGGASTALDDAVRRAVNAGITFVVAAGNDNRSACTSSPARVAEALTVGATTSSDARASFSNYGSCVDIFAPGAGITSAWHTSDSSTNTISGTSMASPHVAGVAALRLSSGNASPAAVGQSILDTATSGRLSGIGSGSPNLLLYALLSGTSEPPPGEPPPTGEPPCKPKGNSGKCH